VDANFAANAVRKEDIMRIAIYGTGGAGGYFGAQLAKAGEDVTFIARGAHLQAIREHGLIVETPAGEVKIHPARATDRVSEIGPVDLVLLGVKAWQVKEAATAMAPLLGPETLVIPLQNGIEAASELTAFLGAGPVLGGLCGTFSWVTGPGRIRNIGSKNFVWFGEVENRRSARTEQVLAAFQRAGIQSEIPTNIQQALWMKFLVVTAFGGVGALARAPIGVLRSLPPTRRLIERCVEETCDLALARRVGLPDDAVAATLDFIDGLAASSTTSLQRDIADGKPSELEYWNGAIVRLAKGNSVSVPTHEIIYDLLLPLERRSRGQLEFPV
jgi:2-dehydropantoate 2-reductase